jgi:hypothetical protein
MTVMRVSQLHISRRTIALSAALVVTVGLAIGAHAALNGRAMDTAKAVATEQGYEVMRKASRVALIIGNGHYPDAAAPLAQPINDARALSASLRRDGFDVDVVEDATKDDMSRALDRLRRRIRSDSVVMLFFGGYGVQVDRQSYMIPVDATIWKEIDVRREGVSVESVLDVMRSRARAPSSSWSTPPAATPMSGASVPSPMGSPRSPRLTTRWCCRQRRPARWPTTAMASTARLSASF